jgi:hypothetical protein
MSLSSDLLLSEADRLVSRAQTRLRSHRERTAALESQSLDAREERELAAIAERDLKRLELYRAVLRGSSNPAHAMMPEYILARGLAPGHADPQSG